VNNKIARIEGNIYRLTSATLGNRVLLSAECVMGKEKGKTLWNLNGSREPRANQIRNLIKLGLVS